MKWLHISDTKLKPGRGFMSVRSTRDVVRSNKPNVGITNAAMKFQTKFTSVLYSKVSRFIIFFVSFKT